MYENELNRFDFNCFNMELKARHKKTSVLPEANYFYLN